MSNYNWQKIFENKENKDLLKIICDKRQYNEEARLVGVEILKARKVEADAIIHVENIIGERVRRRQRVSKIKIPAEISFGFDHFTKQKSFRRKLKLSTFIEYTNRVIYDLNWYVSERGENYFLVEDRPEAFRCERHFTEIKISYIDEVIYCEGEQSGPGLFSDYGRINNRIMKYMNFLDDVIVSYCKGV